MPVREIKTIFSVDGQQKYVDAIKSINKQQQVLNAETKATIERYKLAGNTQAELKTKMNNLTQQIALQRQKVNESEHAFETARQKYGETAQTTQELKIQYEKAKEQLSKFQRQLQQANTDLDNHTNKLKKAGDAAINAGDKMVNAGTKMQKFGNQMSMYVTAPILAGAGAAAKAAMDYESAFTGVVKTVEGTPEQLAAISDGIREMSKELPTSAVEIAAVAEAAGQLAIKTDNILGFTKVMIDLSNATNMTTTEGAEQLARFANIMGMSQTNFDRLGASIVDLGNNSATTEAEIVDMAMRLAGAGKQVGMSEADVMGLAAALSSLGIEAEMGGSAMSKVMIRMQLAAETGAEANEIIAKTGKTTRELVMFADQDAKGFKAMANSLGYTSSEFKNFLDASVALEAFSKATGKTAKDFKDDFEKDATKAVVGFIAALGKIDKEGGSVIGTLEDLDISEVRMRDALLRTTNAGSLLADSIKLSNDAWTDNNALLVEADRRYATTESQILMTKNRITDAGITIGEQLLPVIADLVEDVAKAAEAFADLDPEMQKSIMVALGVAAAIGPVTKALGVVTYTGGAATKAVGKIMQAFAKHKTAAAAASTATQGLGASMVGATASAGPLIAVLGGVALAAAGAYIAYQKANEQFFAAGEAGEKFAGGFKNVAAEVESASSALEGFDFSKIISSDDMSEIDGGITDAHNRIRELAELAASEAREYTDAERKEIEELIGLINDYTQKKIDAYVKQQEVYAAYVSSEKDVNLPRANELIKGSEDAMNQTIAVAEAKFKDMITAAEEQYGHLGEIDERAYQRVVENAKKQRDAQVEQANAAHAETLGIITEKYEAELGEDQKYFSEFSIIGSQIKQAEENRTKYIEEESAKRITAKMSERQKGQTEQDIAKEAQKKYNEETELLFGQLAEAYEGATAANLDNWLYMVAQTELYGGEVDDKTKGIVDGMIASFDLLPEESKEAATNAMLGLKQGMEDEEPSLFEKAKNIADGIISRINKIFDNRSPSHVARRIGSFFGQGLGIGLEESGEDAINTAGDVAGAIVDEASKISQAQEYLRAKLSGSSISTPNLPSSNPVIQTQQTSESRVIHSGKIVVEGVTDKGQVAGVAEIILDQLRMEMMLAGG